MNSHYCRQYSTIWKIENTESIDSRSTRRNRNNNQIYQNQQYINRRTHTHHNDNKTGPNKQEFIPRNWIICKTMDIINDLNKNDFNDLTFECNINILKVTKTDGTYMNTNDNIAYIDGN